MSEKPSHLDYATPQKEVKDVNRVALGLAGMVVGLFGYPCLFLGVRGIVWSLSGRWAMGWDLDTYVVFALVGVGGLCAYLSLKLLRKAFG